jgi:hypothetical protein
MMVELLAALFIPRGIEEGKAILSGMLKAIASYWDLAEDEKGFGIQIKQYILMLQLALPGLILSLTAFLAIVIQSLMLAMLPFFVLSTIISRHPDKYIVFRVCMSYASFTLFQSLLWLFISLYPSNFATGDITQISLADAMTAMIPIVLVSLMIGCVFTALPIKVALGAFKTLAFVRIK